MADGNPPLETANMVSGPSGFPLVTTAGPSLRMSFCYLIRHIRPLSPERKPVSDNLLRFETSPYLLQHQDNPVHWRPWGTAAFEEARRTGKPILLSVGYAACHWCHVMAHESFEDADVAAVMNRLFVNVKVDREERPDVDQIYMTALHALGEQGGWPLTMFLTPAGEPVWGGTYFPKTARYGRPGFVSVMKEIARIFREEPEKIDASRVALVERISATDAAGDGLHADILDRAAAGLLQAMDPINGGLKGAPKFPNASVIELLWRAYFRTRDVRYRDSVIHTLRRIAQGGIYDHVGGGFARYSVDERWLAPHFEKMLYDNAQLIALMTSAWLVGGDDLFRDRIDETVTWLQREMLAEGGAFAASLDADSEGEEGRFYVWSDDEIRQVLGDEDGAYFARLYDSSPHGNWEGKVILNRLNTPDTDDPATSKRLVALRQKLFDRRAGRVPPGRDHKVLADWNGLMIASLARAADVFERPDWSDLAQNAYRFIAESMTRDGRLGHSWCDGKLIYPGLATDHAAMCDAALALNASCGADCYLEDAIRYADLLHAHYRDGDAGGYFLTADDAEDLIMRPKSPADEATPNANGVAVRALVRLWQLTGEPRFRDRIDSIFRAFSSAVPANVFMTASLLNGFDFLLYPVSVVICGPESPRSGDLYRKARLSPHPNLVLCASESIDGLPASHPAFGKEPKDGMATAYVCHGDRCSAPVTDGDLLALMTAGAAAG